MMTAPSGSLGARKETYKQVKTLALDAVKVPFDPDLEPAIINYQQAQAKVEAIRKWEERWHADLWTSLAYRTA